MTSSEQKQKRKDKRKRKKKHRGWVTLTALEICMIAIQLALEPFVFSLVICIQPLSCLKKSLFSWSTQYERSVLPGAGIMARRWEKKC